jgi:hypothetical protein
VIGGPALGKIGERRELRLPQQRVAQQPRNEDKALLGGGVFTAISSQNRALRRHESEMRASDR